MFNAFAMRSLASVATATLSVTSRHDDHDLSPKTLRPRAISGLASQRSRSIENSTSCEDQVPNTLEFRDGYGPASRSPKSM